MGNGTRGRVAVIVMLGLSLMAATVGSAAAADGELTAVVASLTGRAITSVTPPVAEVKRDGSTISAGTPATVVVQEVDAAARNWSLRVELTEDLTSGANTIPKANVQAVAATTAVKLLPLAPTTWSVQDKVAGPLGTQHTLFDVTQTAALTTDRFTGTYTSLVSFTADASEYTGPPAVMKAPFTITIHQ